MNSRLKARVEMIVSHINADPDGHGGPGMIRARKRVRQYELLADTQWLRKHMHEVRGYSNLTSKDAKALNLVPSGLAVVYETTPWVVPKPAEQKVRRFRDSTNEGWEWQSDGVRSWYVNQNTGDRYESAVTLAELIADSDRDPEITDEVATEPKVRRFRAKDGSGTWEGTNDSGVLKTRDGRSHPLSLSTILCFRDEWKEVTA